MSFETQKSTQNSTLDSKGHPNDKIIMAGGRNSSKSKKKSKSGGNNKCEGKEQKRGQEKEKETEKEVCPDHHSASNTTQIDVIDTKENSDIEIDDKKNEPVHHELVTESGPQDTSIINAPQDLEDEISDETVLLTNQDVESDSIKDEKAVNKRRDEFKDIYKQDDSKDTVGDDESDTHLTHHDKKVLDNQESCEEIKPNEPEKEVCPDHHSASNTMLIDVIDTKENNVIEIDDEKNEQIHHVLVKESGPQDTSIINAVLQDLEDEITNETVLLTNQDVKSDSIKDEKAVYKRRDEFKDIYKQDDSKDTVGDDESDTHLIHHDKKVLNDRENCKEIKPNEPIQKPDGNEICKETFQDHVQSIVPKIAQIIQEKFFQYRNSSEAIDCESDTSSVVEPGSISSDGFDARSLLSGNDIENNMQKPDGNEICKETFQDHVQSIVPKIAQVIQEKFFQYRNSSEAIDYESDTSSVVEPESISSDGFDARSLLSGNDIQNTVVDQKNGEGEEFDEDEEFDEELERDDQVAEVNDNIVKTKESLDVVTTIGSTDDIEMKSSQELLRFHSVHGENISLSKNNFRAQRKKESNFFVKGIVFSSRPVAVGEKVSIHLKQFSSYRLSLIAIGFTTNDPMYIADNLPTNVINKGNCVDGFWAEHLDGKYCQENYRLHYFLNSSGNMCFGVNGVDKIEFFWNLERKSPVWAVIDIFGYFTTVEFDVPKEITNTSSVESSRLSDINESGNSFNRSLDDNETNKLCLNYQIPIRFVPLDLYTQFQGSLMTFLEDRGVCITSDYIGCIDGKLTLFPGQTIVVQNLSTGNALFVVGVKFGNPTTVASSTLPEPVKTNVMMDVKDELTITFTERGEIRVKKNLNVPKRLLKVNRSQELWPFIKIFKRNQMIKIWSSITSS